MSHPNPVQRPGQAPPDAAPDRTPGSGGHGLRGVSLFWRIVASNIVLMGMVGVVAALVLSERGSPDASPGVLMVLMVGTVVAAAVLNAWIVALALRPLDSLERTAERVRTGDWSARAPETPSADRRLERLRKVLNEMLDTVAEARERQKELSHRVLRAEERERERIAGELYAGTAQILAGVLVRIKVLERNCDDPEHCLQLEAVSEQVRAALHEIRSTARRLRPPEMDELGVRSALEAHARGLGETSEMRIEFEGQIPDHSLSEDGRLALLRVVQEAMSNAIQHSGGQVVTVSFRHATDGLVAEVADDGVGFDLARLRAAEVPQEHPHLGLFALMERAGFAGGTATVETEPGRGTRVRLVLPWRESPVPEDYDEPEVLVPTGTGAARAAPVIN